MFRRNLPHAWIAGLVVLALGATAARAGDELPTLDKALRDNAPEIVKELRERKYQNVGVLKFLVRYGDGPARDNAGPLNTSLADRLEVALVLALDNDNLAIIGNASKGVVASDNPRATHLTEAGRRELFKINGQKYFHIPWKAGADGVQADAFLTGEARFSPDRRSMRISVQLFDRDNPKRVCMISEFAAASDLRSLTETGITFARGRFDNPAQLVAKAADNAPQPDDGKDELQKKANAALTALRQSPVQLKILYDGDEQVVRPTPVVADKSNVLLQVETPKVRQEVSFTLSNTSNDTYGVVLKINGQNTIKREQQDALDCKRWILKGNETITVTGFQLDNVKIDKFKVQTPYESELNSVYYGDNAGTISMVVFRSGKPEDAAPDKSEEAVAVATVSRGMLSLHGEPMASDLKRFQKQLRKETDSDSAAARSRGLVTGAGGNGNNPVKEVEFHPIPTPELSATIRYYEPRQK
jgi:hypothetical protein